MKKYKNGIKILIILFALFVFISLVSSVLSIIIGNQINEESSEFFPPDMLYFMVYMINSFFIMIFSIIFFITSKTRFFPLKVLLLLIGFEFPLYIVYLITILLKVDFYFSLYQINRIVMPCLQITALLFLIKSIINKKDLNKIE